jgi:hypothetical protein
MQDPILCQGEFSLKSAQSDEFGAEEQAEELLRLLDESYSNGFA